MDAFLARKAGDRASYLPSQPSNPSQPSQPSKLLDVLLGVELPPGREEIPPPPDETKITKRKKLKNKKVDQLDRNVSCASLPEEGEGGNPSTSAPDFRNDAPKGGAPPP